MTRPYVHQPEPDWAARRFRQAARVLGTAQATLARPAGGDAGIVNAGIDAATEAAAWGWFLEEPTPTLRDLLVSGGRLVRDVLSTPEGGDPELHSAERWIAAALLSGDGDAAAEVGRRTTRTPDQPVAELSVLLAQLARGDDDAAAVQAERLAAVAADPSTPRPAAQGLAGLPGLAAAVIHRDAAALAAAARDRDAAVAARHRRLPSRRDWSGVLDRPGAALVLLGVRRGLTPPDGVPTVPLGLLPLGPPAAR